MCPISFPFPRCGHMPNNWASVGKGICCVVLRLLHQMCFLELDFEDIEKRFHSEKRILDQGQLQLVFQSPVAD